MVDKRAVQQGYDNLAETYAAQRSEDGRDIEILSQFLASLSDPERFLDIGCGQGSPILEELGPVATATGIDFSREQLRLADRNVPNAGLIQGDMATLPFRDDTFDALTAYHSLIHLPLDDRESIIAEFARVLKPRGRVLLSEGPEEWEGTNPDWLDSGVEMQWHIAGMAATRDHLRAAGFSISTEWESSEEGEWAFLSAQLDE